MCIRQRASRCQEAPWLTLPSPLPGTRGRRRGGLLARAEYFSFCAAVGQTHCNSDRVITCAAADDDILPARCARDVQSRENITNGRLPPGVSPGVLLALRLPWEFCNGRISYSELRRARAREQKASLITRSMLKLRCAIFPFATRIIVPRQELTPLIRRVNVRIAGRRRRLISSSA